MAMAHALCARCGAEDPTTDHTQDPLVDVFARQQGLEKEFVRCLRRRRTTVRFEVRSAYEAAAGRVVHPVAWAKVFTDCKNADARHSIIFHQVYVTDLQIANNPLALPASLSAEVSSQDPTRPKRGHGWAPEYGGYLAAGTGEYHPWQGVPLESWALVPQHGRAPMVCPRDGIGAMPDGAEQHTPAVHEGEQLQLVLHLVHPQAWEKDLRQRAEAAGGVDMPIVVTVTLEWYIHVATATP